MSRSEPEPDRGVFCSPAGYQVVLSDGYEFGPFQTREEAWKCLEREEIHVAGIYRYGDEYRFIACFKDWGTFKTLDEVEMFIRRGPPKRSGVSPVRNSATENAGDQIRDLWRVFVDNKDICLCKSEDEAWERLLDAAPFLSGVFRYRDGYQVLEDGEVFGWFSDEDAALKCREEVFERLYAPEDELEGGSEEET
jgi:hypothetical protein